MADWSNPPQLAALRDFYAAERLEPSLHDDAAVLAQVESSFWATNCFAFAEAAFAIIAPACTRRPHLAKPLLRYPIDALIQGGVQDSATVIPFATDRVGSDDRYVEPTEEGKKWLLDTLPQLNAVVEEVFAEVVKEIDSDM